MSFSAAHVVPVPDSKKCMHEVHSFFGLFLLIGFLFQNSKMTLLLLLNAEKIEPSFPELSLQIDDFTSPSALPKDPPFPRTIL